MAIVPELDHYVGRRVTEISTGGDATYTIRLEGNVDFKVHDKLAKVPAKGVLNDAVLQTVILHGESDSRQSKKTRLHFSNGAEVEFNGAEVGISRPEDEREWFPQSYTSTLSDLPDDPSEERIREGPDAPYDNE